MSMTKKDYEIIANAVKSAMDLERARHSAAVQGCRAVAETLAATFRLNHQQFKPEVFMKACGFSKTAIVSHETWDSFKDESISTGD